MFLKRLLRDNLAVSDHTRTRTHTHACADVHNYLKIHLFGLQLVYKAPDMFVSELKEYFTLKMSFLTTFTHPHV